MRRSDWCYGNGDAETDDGKKVNYFYDIRFVLQKNHLYYTKFNVFSSIIKKISFSTGIRFCECLFFNAELGIRNAEFRCSQSEQI